MRQRLGGGLFALVVALGVMARLRLWADGSSLWFDELLVVLNLARLSPAELLGPLDWDQSAPPMWLWMQQGLFRLGGVSERLLRLPALLAGLAALPLLYLWVRDLAGPLAGRWAVALYALSPLAIAQSAQLKPYGVDALVALALGWGTLRLLRRQRGYLGLGVAGAVALTVSTPTPAVLAACGVALWAGRKELRLRLRAIALVLCWGLSAGAWVQVWPGAQPSDWMLQYWHEALVLVNREGDVHRFVSAMVGLSREAVGAGVAPPWAPRLGGPEWVLALPLFLLGVFGATRLRWDRRWLLLGPFLAVVAASAVGLYPLAPRLMMVCLPGLVGMAALGLSRCGPWGAPLLLPSLLLALHTVGSPPRPEHTRPLVHQILADREAGDRVWVLPRALPAWLVYGDGLQPASLHRWAQTLSSGGIAHYAGLEGSPDLLDRGVLRDGDLMVALPNGALAGWGRGALPARVPSASWTQTEARRVSSEGARWMLFAHHRPKVEQALLQALDGQPERLGGGPGASLWRR